jgi:hypothetical protein
VHARTAEENWVPQNGARVVAKAWVDPAFKQGLLEKGKAAVAEFGLSMPPHHRHLVALENWAKLHNVVVCPQSSCTAYTIIGLPPDWYKDFGRPGAPGRPNTPRRAVLTAGDRVRVKDDFVTGRVRMPACIRGKSATVVAVVSHPVVQGARITQGNTRSRPPASSRCSSRVHVRTRARLR